MYLYHYREDSSRKFEKNCLWQSFFRQSGEGERHLAKSNGVSRRSSLPGEGWRRWGRPPLIQFRPHGKLLAREYRVIREWNQIGVSEKRKFISWVNFRGVIGNVMHFLGRRVQICVIRLLPVKFNYYTIHTHILTVVSVARSINRFYRRLRILTVINSCKIQGYLRTCWNSWGKFEMVGNQGNLR